MLILNEYDLNTIKDTVYNYLESIEKITGFLWRKKLGSFWHGSLKTIAKHKSTYRFYMKYYVYADCTNLAFA